MSSIENLIGKDIDKKRLLVISNNVLSTTKNNGKTVLSYIDVLPKNNVRQLYFSAEHPEVPGYEYFCISDKNVIKGILNPLARGKRCLVRNGGKIERTQSLKATVGKNALTRAIREILWMNGWKSRQLIDWLDEFKPMAVFFVAGDSIFAYSIYRFVLTRYDAIGSLYITDDYIMPRKDNSFLDEFLRRKIIKNIDESLKMTKNFYTISTPMKIAYSDLFERDSKLIVNMTEPLKTIRTINKSKHLTLVYAGSLYYGRDKILSRLAEEINIYNGKSKTLKAFLKIYTNAKMSDDTKKKLEIDGSCGCFGSLNKEELRIELNNADILVFVESFDLDQIEKTRFSLSTKVPEYLSLEKPILAIGPRGIGSIEYLDGVSMLVDRDDLIYKGIAELLDSQEIRDTLAKEAYKKYEKNHIKGIIQTEFICDVFNIK